MRYNTCKYYLQATFSGCDDSVLRFTTETLIIPDTYYFPDSPGEASQGKIV